MGLGEHIRTLRIRGKRQERTAFVLAGGGVLGAIQVGQLDALLQAGVTPDFLVGTSVGALNALAIAKDPTADGIAYLRDVWSSLTPHDIFPGTWLQRAWHFVRKGDHLYPNTGIRKLIARAGVERFEDLSVPLSVCAANLRTGAEHWFDIGPVEPALLASTALPGIFPPVIYDGEVLVDGGVVNNVPISRAVELGATKIYVLRCGSVRSNDRPIRRPLDVLMQAVVHSRGVRVDLDMTRYSAEAEINVLPIFDPGVRRFDDPTHAARTIDRARALTQDFLATSSARV